MNRVYDSSGPDGKVRGTPQQIIDKYQLLSRDAFTAGDHVAGESYLQHAEHYARILSNARRLQQQRRDERYPEYPADGPDGQGSGSYDRHYDAPADFRDTASPGGEGPSRMSVRPMRPRRHESSRQNGRANSPSIDADRVPGDVSSRESE